MRRGALLALALLATAPGCRREEASGKLKTLDEILSSKDDNDPRLDRDFQDLSPETKRLFRLKYRALPRQRRNDRGTIVYLLGLNLRSAEDWEFLREVVNEPPCLSLADCAKPGAVSMGDEVTLAYPALVALRQAARSRGGAEGEAVRVLQAAKDSKMPAVGRMVSRLEQE